MRCVASLNHTAPSSSFVCLGVTKPLLCSGCRASAVAPKRFAMYLSRPPDVPYLFACLCTFLPPPPLPNLPLFLSLFPLLPSFLSYVPSSYQSSATSAFGVRRPLGERTPDGGYARQGSWVAMARLPLGECVRRAAGVLVVRPVVAAVGRRLLPPAQCRSGSVGGGRVTEHPFDYDGVTEMPGRHCCCPSTPLFIARKFECG